LISEKPSWRKKQGKQNMLRVGVSWKGLTSCVMGETQGGHGRRDSYREDGNDERRGGLTGAAGSTTE
jgi:hypothetical protein